MSHPDRGPLISAEELRPVLDAVTLLDVRYRLGGPAGLEEYGAGHLPGAAYVDLDAELAGTQGEGRHPLPDPADFQRAMRRAGVRNDRPVVVYDDWGGRAAARCWWLLRWAGHRDVRVLDGGWTGWLATGGPTDMQKSVEPGDFIAEIGVLPVLAVGDVLALAERGVLIDARAPERYRGDVEPIDPVAGHVPGAVNVSTDRNLDSAGRFRPVAELRAAYAGVGAVPEAEVAVYCGSGVTACHDILALAVAGVPAALYPGSWSGWVSDPSRPVATG